jgi:hypothetical protein
MSAGPWAGGAVDLVVDRLLIEGVDLTPERGAELVRLLEEELRPLVAGGGLSALPDEGLSEAKPTSFGQPVELRTLARVMARRVARGILEAGGDHGGA